MIYEVTIPFARCRRASTSSTWPGNLDGVVWYKIVPYKWAGPPAATASRATRRISTGTSRASRRTRTGTATATSRPNSSRAPTTLPTVCLHSCSPCNRPPSSPPLPPPAPPPPSPSPPSPPPRRRRRRTRRRAAVAAAAAREAAAVSAAADAAAAVAAAAAAARGAAAAAGDDKFAVDLHNAFMGDEPLVDVLRKGELGQEDGRKLYVAGSFPGDGGSGWAFLPTPFNVSSYDPASTSHVFRSVAVEVNADVGTDLSPDVAFWYKFVACSSTRSRPPSSTTGWVRDWTPQEALGGEANSESCGVIVDENGTPR